MSMPGNSCRLLCGNRRRVMSSPDKRSHVLDSNRPWVCFFPVKWSCLLDSDGSLVLSGFILAHRVDWCDRLRRDSVSRSPTSDRRWGYESSNLPRRWGSRLCSLPRRRAGTGSLWSISILAKFSSSVDACKFIDGVHISWQECAIWSSSFAGSGRCASCKLTMWSS
ncbi:hypothetical protein Mapa_016884 [Marchantia paleacea]|nr:hypothetical protein Mapa_016884 [Marchantia paleacea]